MAIKRWMMGGFVTTSTNGISAFFLSCGFKVAPEHFRVPDVTLSQPPSSPRTWYLILTLPLAVFEILSPDDAMAGVMDKLEAYDAMGIQAIWLIDPRKNIYRRYHQGKLIEADVFEMPGELLSVCA